jgi:hypothetical protein
MLVLSFNEISRACCVSTFRLDKVRQQFSACRCQFSATRNSFLQIGLKFKRSLSDFTGTIQQEIKRVCLAHVGEVLSAMARIIHGLSFLRIRVVPSLRLPAEPTLIMRRSPKRKQHELQRRGCEQSSQLAFFRELICSTRASLIQKKNGPWNVSPTGRPDRAIEL